MPILPLQCPPSLQGIDQNRPVEKLPVREYIHADKRYSLHVLVMRTWRKRLREDARHFGIRSDLAHHDIAKRNVLSSHIQVAAIDAVQTLTGALFL
eukprot:6198553-Pleurochrysis_carterae.AAC.1